MGTFKGQPTMTELPSAAAARSSKLPQAAL
jgi:hypothetical protein